MFTGETVVSSDRAPSHDIRHFIDEKPIASPSGDGGQSTTKSAGRSLPDVENISLPEGKWPRVVLKLAVFGSCWCRV